MGNRVSPAVTGGWFRSHMKILFVIIGFALLRSPFFFYSFFFRDYLGSIFTTKAHEVTFSEPAPFFEGSLLFSSVIPFCKCHRIKY